MGEVNAQLSEAIRRIGDDDREAGKQLLLEVLKADPENDRAWLWMSAVVDGDDLRRECLEEALKHNPRNRQARRALAKLGKGTVYAAAPVADGKTKAPARARAERKKGPTDKELLFSFLTGLLFAAVALLGLRNEVRLRLDHATAQGQVTDAQIEIRTRGRKVYEVRYSFLAGEQGAWYTSDDDSGWGSEWRGIPEDDWNRAVAEGQLQVLYVPSDPAVNRPVAGGGGFAFMLIFCLMGLVFVAWAAAHWIGKRLGLE